MTFSGQHCEFLSEKAFCDLYRKTDLQDPPYKHMDMLPYDIPDLSFRTSMTDLFPASAAEKAARPAHETGHGPAAGITHISSCSRHSPKGILPLLIPAATAFHSLE